MSVFGVTMVDDDDFLDFTTLSSLTSFINIITDRASDASTRFSSRDDLFVDAANGDYRLFPSSGLVDAGNSSGIPTDSLDLAGGPRILGASVDIGAFETATAFVTVTNLNDSGAGSLRDAIQTAAAVGAGLITFDPSLAGGTITLSSTLGTVDVPLAIDGDIDDDGTPDITVAAGGAFRFLEVTTRFELDGLTLTGFDAGAGNGGAILASAATEVINAAFENNSATQGGALAAVDGGQLTVSGTLFQGNDADGDGGAIFAARTDLAVATSRFEDNSAFNAGAIRIEGDAGTTLTVDRSAFEGNSAAILGGDLSAEDVDALVSNTLFVSNTALASQHGVFDGGTARLVNVTAFDTDTSLDIVRSGGAAIEFVNTIADFGLGGPSGTNLASSSALFVDAAGGDFRPLPGSAAFDAGDDTAAVGTLDFDGAPRIAFSGIDVGALEFADAPLVFTVTNTNDSGVGSLRAALEGANATSAADTIVFDPSLAGETIALASTLASAP